MSGFEKLKERLPQNDKFYKFCVSTRIVCWLVQELVMNKFKIKMIID